MKKYIVRVQYTESPGDLIWLVKAKNDKILENIMAKELSESLSLIDGFEYEQINNRSFEKNEINSVCGNWIGVEIIEDDLKNLKENKK